MKGIEVTLDGVKYFVTATLAGDNSLVLELYLGSLRSAHIYHEYIENPKSDAVRKFDKRHAKKFIKRALSK